MRQRQNYAHPCKQETSKLPRIVSGRTRARQTSLNQLSSPVLGECLQILPRRGSILERSANTNQARNLRMSTSRVARPSGSWHGCAPRSVATPWLVWRGAVGPPGPSWSGPPDSPPYLLVRLGVSHSGPVRYTCLFASASLHSPRSAFI